MTDNSPSNSNDDNFSYYEDDDGRYYFFDENSPHNIHPFYFSDGTFFEHAKSRLRDHNEYVESFEPYSVDSEEGEGSFEPYSPDNFELSAPYTGELGHDDSEESYSSESFSDAELDFSEQILQSSSRLGAAVYHASPLEEFQEFLQGEIGMEHVATFDSEGDQNLEQKISGYDETIKQNLQKGKENMSRIQKGLWWTIGGLAFLLWSYTHFNAAYNERSSQQSKNTPVYRTRYLD